MLQHNHCSKLMMKMNDEIEDDTPDPLKFKPSERAERTDAAFRQIVENEKRAQDAKTARLKAARLARDAEAIKSGHLGDSSEGKPASVVNRDDG